MTMRDGLRRRSVAEPLSRGDTAIRVAAMDPVASAAASAAPSLWQDFWTTTFMPHGCCYQWQPLIIWMHVLSDAFICLAYYSIPIILFAFVRKRRDVPFNAIFVIFGVFIMACGTTHLLEVVDVWYPVYRLSAVVKIITAIVSVLAVGMLIPILPKALALPSLHSANAALHKASIELKRSNAELEQFAYVASHDLQEPLRMVSMHVELLKRRHGPALDATGQAYLAIAAKGASRMQSLVASLLSFARIDQVPVGLAEADANQALAEALDVLAQRIAASQATVTHERLPPLRMDPSQLSVVFQNLVANAITFHRSGVAPTVHISSRSQGGEVVISVQDHGIGISPEYRERVFVIFQRIHDSDTYEGSGIGLASVKKIVERHGGRVWIESVPGQGTTVHFSVLSVAPSPGSAHAP